MKTLVYGSVNRDMVYHLPHFVLPQETLDVLTYETFLGGKGLNQATALARAGSDTWLAANIGEADSRIVNHIAEMGIKTNYIRLWGDLPTGHAIIQVDKQGQNSIIICGGTNRKIDKEQIDHVFSGFDRGDLLVLQNEVNMVGELIFRAHEIGMQIAINPAPIDEMASKLPYELVDWIILNEIEGQVMTGEAVPIHIASRLLEHYPELRVVLTLGAGGVLYQDSTQQLSHGIYDVPVVDTTGAGDTFIGFFLASATKGIPVKEALRIASVASSIAVSRKGASSSIPTLDEVLAESLPLDQNWIDPLL